MKESKVFTLIFCVLGLYALFLSWSLLQERINTKPYDHINSNPVYFKAPLVTNTVQALFAALVGLVYSLVAHRKSPFAVFSSPKDHESTGGLTFFKYFVVIALTSSLSAPVGYQSLKHVDYLVYLLAKSCKLLPVMFVHFVLYRTKFPPHKYMVAALVTAGVTVFTLGHSGSKKESINDGNTLLGMAQLISSMLLDGFTNSTQDQMFRLRTKTHKVTGASLMCILNLLVFSFTLSYMVVFKFDLELAYTYSFITKYPHALMDILAFSVFGAVGQVFVFIILEKFDSLILVTATVTRKMISMILSVMLFGHHLNLSQWSGVALVFGGIGYESYVKIASKKKTKAEKAE